MPMPNDSPQHAQPLMFDVRTAACRRNDHSECVNPECICIRHSQYAKQVKYEMANTKLVDDAQHAQDETSRELERFIEDARRRGPMTDAERKVQRESWVRGELGIGNDRDEAETRQRVLGPQHAQEGKMRVE